MSRAFDLEQVVEELQDGISREENFRLLFDRFWPALSRFFARCGIPRDERHDLTQETFLGIYTGIGGFRREARFETWMFSIAANVYRKHLRRQSAAKREAQELSLDETDPAGAAPLAQRLPDESGSVGDPEHSLLGDERTRRLLGAVDGLPERMRKCLILRVFQELSYDEIAVVMKVSPETVRSHLFQARRRLKERLADHG